MGTPALPHRLEAGFDGLYGLEVTEAGDGLIRGRVRIGDEHKQPAGLVHGGVYCSMAEAMTSMATFLAVQPERVAMGLSNQTSFVRPLFGGTVHAEARCRHRGRTTWIWEVDFTDDDGRLCAITRMTIAVRERSG